MPSLSGMLRHHLPPYEKIKSLLYVRLNSIRTLVTRQGGSQYSDSECKPQHDEQHLQSRQGSHSELAPGKPETSICSYPNTNHMEEVTTTHTYINGGKNDKNDQVGGRGIHLRYDLQQSWFDASISEDRSSRSSHLSPV